MDTTDYSNSILPYIPFFYVIWSDDLLSASEIEVVKTAIKEDNSLDDIERKQLYSWLNRNNPPNNNEIKNWQQLITNSNATLIESENHPLEAFSRKVASFYCNSCSNNEQLKKIELNLGIQPNHYSHLFNVEVVHQAYSNTFNGKEIDNILNKKFNKNIKDFRAFLNQELFAWHIETDKE